MLLLTWECKSLFKLVFLFPFDIFPELEFLDHTLVLLLMFWKSSTLFSIVAVPIHQHLLSFIFLMMAWGDISLWFWFAFSYNELHEHFFYVSVGHAYIFFEKCLLRSFAHLLFGLIVCLFCYWIVCILYIFWVLNPYQMYGSQIFLPIL